MTVLQIWASKLDGTGVWTKDHSEQDKDTTGLIKNLTEKRNQEVEQWQDRPKQTKDKPNQWRELEAIWTAKDRHNHLAFHYLNMILIPNFLTRMVLISFMFGCDSKKCTNPPTLTLDSWITWQQPLFLCAGDVDCTETPSVCVNTLHLLPLLTCSELYPTQIHRRAQCCWPELNETAVYFWPSGAAHCCASCTYFCLSAFPHSHALFLPTTYTDCRHICLRTIKGFDLTFCFTLVFVIYTMLYKRWFRFH